MPCSQFRCCPAALCSLTAGAVLSGLLFLLAGCNPGDGYQTVTTEDAERAEAHADHEHEHHHEAPHEGHLIELGDHQYNAEIVLEPDPKQLVVYLLDAHAERSIEVDAQVLALIPEGAEPIALEPQPLEGDAEGRSSRFVGKGPAVNALGDIEDLHGSIKVTIEGTEYAGELSHDHDSDHDHGHTDHEHGDEAHQ